LVKETYDSINTALSAKGETPIGWENLHLNIPHISQHYYGNTDAKTQEEETISADGFGGPEHRAEIADALRFAAAQSKSNHGSVGMRLLERAYRREALRYLETGNTRIPCSALLATAYVSAKGEVYPCTIWDKPLGNIREHGYSLAPIVARARKEGVRADVASGRCPRCWTPCEAYPALVSSPFRAARALIA
jgi:hypothetical protein